MSRSSSKADLVTIFLNLENRSFGIFDIPLLNNLFIYFLNLIITLLNNLFISFLNLFTTLVNNLFISFLNLLISLIEVRNIH